MGRRRRRRDARALVAWLGAVRAFLPRGVRGRAGRRARRMRPAPRARSDPALVLRRGDGRAERPRLDARRGGVLP